MGNNKRGHVPNDANDRRWGLKGSVKGVFEWNYALCGEWVPKEGRYRVHQVELVSEELFRQI